MLMSRPSHTHRQTDTHVKVEQYSAEAESAIVGSVYTIQMYTLENSLSPKQRHHQTVKYPPIVDGIYSIPIYSTDTYSPIVFSVVDVCVVDVVICQIKIDWIEIM